MVPAGERCEHVELVTRDDFDWLLRVYAPGDGLVKWLVVAHSSLHFALQLVHRYRSVAQARHEGLNNGRTVAVVGAPYCWVSAIDCEWLKGIDCMHCSGPPHRMAALAQIVVVNHTVHDPGRHSRSRGRYVLVGTSHC